jgi:hypothetical protein
MVQEFSYAWFKFFHTHSGPEGPAGISPARQGRVQVRQLFEARRAGTLLRGRAGAFRRPDDADVVDQAAAASRVPGR